MTYTTRNQKNAQQIGKWDYKYAYKFAFTLSVIFISKTDNDCRIFEVQLLNLAAFHFDMY